MEENTQGPEPFQGQLHVGDQIAFSRTVADADISLFGGLSGDLHPIHMDNVYARSRGQRGRIAHGAFTLALMSAAGGQLHLRLTIPTVSYGFDRVRFLLPVHVGDTLTTSYTVTGFDPSGRKSYAECRCTNQDGEVVAVATHIEYHLPATGTAGSAEPGERR
jgi:3-hydroxybutyryl-CoA dehydratase